MNCADTLRPPVLPSAFTLIQLLVVIGTIAILASLLLPTLTRPQSKAQPIRCLSNDRQLQLCSRIYKCPPDRSTVRDQDWIPGPAVSR